MSTVARAAGVLAVILACSGQAYVPGMLNASAHHTISTNSSRAQGAFDDGLAMLYAFNVGQARALFRDAAKDDPACAMAYWGQAEAETIDINRPQTDDGDTRGAAAIALARSHLGTAAGEERALIEALALRFPSGGTTAAHFHAYAEAMAHVARTYPADADALTLAAYARWNDVGNLLDAHGQPVPGALEMQRELTTALVLDPANLGAHHLRIHLTEQIGRPVDGLSDAQYFDRLTFAPGMSHLPHMAGHIYARLGDYDALIAANQRALTNDAMFFASGNGEGQTYIREYHDHDLDFVAYGLTTQGRNAEAHTAMANEDTRMKLRVALRARDPAAIELAATAKNEPLRAIALARGGRIVDADAIVRAFPHDGDDDARAVRAIATAIVARDEGKLTVAATQYRLALNLLGSDPGDPKNAWPYPAGEGLGAVLLLQSRYADADATFAGELARFPNDPRLAFGLAEAEKAQGKDDTAARAIVTREWHGAAPITLGMLG